MESTNTQNTLPSSNLSSSPSLTPVFSNFTAPSPINNEMHQEFEQMIRYVNEKALKLALEAKNTELSDTERLKKVKVFNELLEDAQKATQGPLIGLMDINIPKNGGGFYTSALNVRVHGEPVVCSIGGRAHEENLKPWHVSITPRKVMMEVSETLIKKEDSDDETENEKIETLKKEIEDKEAENKLTSVEETLPPLKSLTLKESIFKPNMTEVEMKRQKDEKGKYIFKLFHPENKPIDIYAFYSSHVAEPSLQDVEASVNVVRLPHKTLIKTLKHSKKIHDEADLEHSARTIMALTSPFTAYQNDPKIEAFKDKHLNIDTVESATETATLLQYRISLLPPFNDASLTESKDSGSENTSRRSSLTI